VRADIQRWAWYEELLLRITKKKRKDNTSPLKAVIGESRVIERVGTGSETGDGATATARGSRMDQMGTRERLFENR
jgi:hypothetical protein